MAMTTDTPCRIYAACLASYNSGRLYGAWIDCEGKSGAELRVEIDDMLAASPEPNVLRRKRINAAIEALDGAQALIENHGELRKSATALKNARAWLVDAEAKARTH
jgi:hypothetical protein